MKRQLLAFVALFSLAQHLGAAEAGNTYAASDLIVVSNELIHDAHARLQASVLSMIKPLTPHTSLSILSGSTEDYIAEFHTNRGGVLFEHGNMQDALTEYEAAVSVSPSNADAHFNLGAMHSRLNNLKAAESSLRTALSYNRYNAGYYVGLGAVLLRQKAYAQTVDYLKKGIDLDNHQADAQFNLGLGLFGTESYVDALRAFRRANKLKTNESDIHFAIGVTQLLINDTTAAIRTFNECTKSKPQNPDYYIGLGAALFEDHQYEKAIEAFFKTDLLQKKNTAAHNQAPIIVSQQSTLIDTLSAIIRALETAIMVNCAMIVCCRTCFR